MSNTKAYQLLEGIIAKNDIILMEAAIVETADRGAQTQEHREVGERVPTATVAIEGDREDAASLPALHRPRERR